MSFQMIRVILLLVFVFSLCNADVHKYEVVGIGECGDCNENNFKSADAFRGLHVTIDCKLKIGEIKRIRDGELDEDGKFKIVLPREIVRDDNNLKEECYAQLHSAAAIPCPTHEGIEAAKIIFKSKINDKYTFTPSKSLKFSSVLCTSKFLWPYLKYPPLPKHHSWKKTLPKINFPPMKKWPPLYKTKPFPPKIPIYKPPFVTPLPPTIPVYKPKPPIVEPIPPPVPTYKPKPPVVKPIPPPIPMYKPKPPVVKAIPPPTPIYKPKPPMVKPIPPPTPIYKPKPHVVKPVLPPTPVYKPKPKPPPTPIYKPKPKPKPPIVQPIPPPIPVYKAKPEPPIVEPLPPIPEYPMPPFFKKKPIPPFLKKPIPPFFKKPCPPKFGHFPPLN